jgi:hypothetical protein
MLCVRNVNEVDDDFLVDGDDDNFVALEEYHCNIPIDQDAFENKGDECQADHSLFHS